MAVDSFSHSSSDLLNDLDPLSRALLDLSVQRGMDDAEIASVLGTDEESVLEVRVGLLRNLAEKVAPEHSDDDVPELQAVIAERLYAEPAAEPDVDDEPVVDPEPESHEDDRPTALRAVPAWAEPESGAAAATRTKPRKRRSPLIFLVPLLLVALIAAGIVALTSGGDGSDDAPEPAPAAQQPPAAAPDKPADAEPKPSPRATRLEAIGGSGARGTASLDGDRLKLKLRGLPAPQGGAYEVWLYDSVIDAKSLATSEDQKVDLDAKLPANAADYEFVDVSFEPADGNPNHSGESVLRVPLKKLR